MSVAQHAAAVQHVKLAWHLMAAWHVEVARHAGQGASFAAFSHCGPCRNLDVVALGASTRSWHFRILRILAY